MGAAPLHSGGAPEYVGFEARAGGEGGGDILSFMGVKVMRFFKRIKEYDKGIVWKRIIKQNQSSRLAVGIGLWLASFL